MKKLIAAAFIASFATTSFARENGPNASPANVQNVIQVNSVAGNQPEIGSRTGASLFVDTGLSVGRLMGDPGSKQ